MPAQGDAAQQRGVAPVLQPGGVGQHEDPLAVGVGFAVVPGRLAWGAVVAGGEVGHQRGAVVIAADGQDEADPRPGVGPERRQHGGAGGIGDRGDAHLAALAGEQRHRVGRQQGVLRIDPEPAQALAVGHQHAEAGAGELLGEGDQARLVLAAGAGPGQQHQSRQGPGLGQGVEVGRVAAGLSGDRQRQALHAGRHALAGQVAQQLPGLPGARQDAAGPAQREQGDQHYGGLPAPSPGPEPAQGRGRGAPRWDWRDRHAVSASADCLQPMVELRRLRGRARPVEGPCSRPPASPYCRPLPQETGRRCLWARPGR